VAGRDEVRQLRADRKVIKNIAARLEAESIPMTCENEGQRYKACVDLLLMAARWPINRDLIRAVVEISGYNDRVARLLLQQIAENDYANLIKKARRNA